MTMENSPTALLSGVCAAVAADLVTQPALFPVESPKGFPSGSATLFPVSRGQYSGARVTLDEDRVRLVGALKLLNLSDRKIAAMAQCARESIPQMVAEAERRGWLRPIKERLTASLGALAEDAVSASREIVEDIRDGKASEGAVLALRALGPMVGITTEKLLLLTGQPTEIRETRPAGDPAAHRAWLQALAPTVLDVTPVAAGLPESESRGMARIPAANGAPAESVGAAVAPSDLERGLAVSALTGAGAGQLPTQGGGGASAEPAGRPAFDQ
jgi:hypothetical protein